MAAVPDRARTPVPAHGHHPVVLEALAAFDSAGVTHALLRGSEPPRQGGDVDLLVAADHLEVAEACLRSAGWLRAPAAGHGSHRFHVRYDTATATWHQLDLVTRLDFGSLLELRTELAAACLARRYRPAGLWVLDPDDTFWLLFLHQAWKQPSEDRRRRLAEAALVAAGRGPLAAHAAVHLDGVLGLEAALDAARSGDEPGMEALHQQLRTSWRKAEGGRALARRTGTWVRRRAVKPREPGFSLALLGLDGAGKTTVTARLQDDVPWPTVSLYMGVWRESALDRVVAPIIGAQLLLRLGRLSRNALVIRYHVAMGRVVLLDRYVVDATLPSPDLDWKGRVSAVLVLRTAAAPDRMIFLDAPAEVVFARKGEIGTEELEQRRAHYLGLRSQFPQWVTVDATKPLDAVLAEVNQVLWDDLRASRNDQGGTG